MKSPRVVAYVALTLITLLAPVLGVSAELVASSQSVSSSRFAFQVKRSPDISNPSFLSDLGEVSRVENKVIVVDSIVNGQRAIFVTSGGDGQRWLEDGYHSFFGAEKIAVRPLEDLPHSNVHYFYETTDRAMVNKICDIAVNHGIEGEILPIKEWVFLITRLAYQVSVAVLLIVLLGFAFVLMQAKAFGVYRLHGLGAVRALAEECRKVIRGAGLVAGLLGLVIVSVVSLFAGDSFWRFVRYCFIALMVLGAATCASILCALGLLWLEPVAAGLKGKIPGRFVIPFAGMGVAIVLVTVMGSVVETSSLYKNYRSHLAQQYVWKGHESIVRAYVTAAQNGESDDKSRLFAEKLEPVVNQGGLLISKLDEINYKDSVAVVNYSAAQLVTLGELSPPARDDTVLIFGDETMVDYSPDNQHAVCEIYTCCVESDHAPQVVDWSARPTFGSHVLRSPVAVVVVPDHLVIDYPLNLSAYVSQGSAIFRDIRAYESAIQDEFLASQISSSSLVADEWFSGVRDVEVELFQRAVQLVVGAVLVLASVVGLVVLLCLLRRQRLWVEFLHGVSLLRRQRVTLLGLGVLVVGCAVWVAQRLHRQAVALADIDFIGREHFEMMYQVLPSSLVIIGAGVGVVSVVGFAVSVWLAAHQTRTQP